MDRIAGFINRAHKATKACIHLCYVWICNRKLSVLWNDSTSLMTFGMTHVCQ